MARRKALGAGRSELTPSDGQGAVCVGADRCGKLAEFAVCVDFVELVELVGLVELAELVEIAQFVGCAECLEFADWAECLEFALLGLRSRLRMSIKIASKPLHR